MAARNFSMFRGLQESRNQVSMLSVKSLHLSE